MGQVLGGVERGRVERDLDEEPEDRADRDRREDERPSRVSTADERPAGHERGGERDYTDCPVDRGEVLKEQLEHPQRAWVRMAGVRVAAGHGQVPTIRRGTRKPGDEGDANNAEQE